MEQQKSKSSTEITRNFLHILQEIDTLLDCAKTVAIGHVSDDINALGHLGADAEPKLEQNHDVGNGQR